MRIKIQGIALLAEVSPAKRGCSEFRVVRSISNRGVNYARPPAGSTDLSSPIALYESSRTSWWGSMP